MKEIKQKKMKPIAKKENLFFIAALFAIALAGDLMWWQSKQMSDEIEIGASLYSVSVRSDYRELSKLSQDIEAADADATRELNTLEAAQ
jgi:hypothetical protein